VLRKAILVCVVLSLAVNLGVATEQTDEKIAKYELQKKRGTSLMFAGLGTGVLGSFLGALAIGQGMGGEASADALGNAGVAVAIGGGVMTVAGILIYNSAARGIRNLKEKNRSATLEVHGPSTACGGSLGDMSIVFRY
jgi:hypothetical protein